MIIEASKYLLASIIYDRKMNYLKFGGGVF